MSAARQADRLFVLRLEEAGRGHLYYTGAGFVGDRDRARVFSDPAAARKVGEAWKPRWQGATFAVEAVGVIA